MAWSVTADPVRFNDAVEWFASRMPLDVRAADLESYAAKRAFKIAGVAQLDIVQQVHDSLTRAIEAGTPLAEWQAEVEEELTRAWGRKDSPRIETIFRNATQSSYNAGRWRAMNSPEVLRHRPFGRFDGVNDSRQTPICNECDGTVLPLDDPWWLTHSPQLHHRCRSGIQNIRATEAQRRGVTTAPPSTDAAPGFGLPPTDSDWQPDASKYSGGLFDEYGRKQEALERRVPRKKLPKDD